MYYFEEDLLTNKVLVDFNVLGSFMEGWIGGHLYCIGIGTLSAVGPKIITPSSQSRC